MSIEEKINYVKGELEYRTDTDEYKSMDSCY